MRIEELQFVCQEAAKDLVASKERPFNPVVVLPRPDRTRLVELPGFPPDEEDQRELLANLANDTVLAESIPAYGFLAEAEIDGTDVLLVVYGARKHHPMVTAAGLSDDGLTTEFQEPEELDPSALPFLHPLQRAVDSLEAQQVAPPGGEGTEGLPIVP